MPDEFNITVKELEILRLIALGRMNKQIADDLGTTEQVVKNYVSRILKKIGAVNRIEAVVKASQYKLIQIDTLPG